MWDEPFHFLLRAETAGGHSALELDQDETMQQLLTSNDVNRVTEDGMSMLMFAAERGNVDHVKRLLAAKADPKQRRKNGEWRYRNRGNECVISIEFSLIIV
jgi:hypothetical protein